MSQPSQPRARILIVDDDRAVAEGLRDLLVEEGFATVVAGSCAEARACLAGNLYDVALLDLRMPDVSGIDMLRICREADPAIGTLMLTAYGTVETTARAFKLGARDFLTKPIRRPALLEAVERALAETRVARELRALRRRAAGAASFAAVVGDDPQLAEVRALAEKAAASDIAVVIQGETGTGKDLLAAAIHGASARAERALVTAVLGAVPEPLQKSALFGHVKSAFTGADQARHGLFEEADGSTLFLDEVTEMTPETQVALLRALEHKLIRPVGAATELRVDVRIIAATNRDLRQAVRDGRFRDDLYYRLGGLFITLPPLRRRKGDIPRLVAHLAQAAVGPGRPVPEFEPDALAALVDYDWPGNVRELRNVIERALLLAGGGPVRRGHCLLYPAAEPRSDWLEAACRLPLDAALDSFKTEYLKRLLDRCGGDKKKVAALAGRHVTRIREMLRELGLGREEADAQP